MTVVVVAGGGGFGPPSKWGVGFRSIIEKNASTNKAKLPAPPASLPTQLVATICTMESMNLYDCVCLHLELTWYLKKFVAMITKTTTKQQLPRATNGFCGIHSHCRIKDGNNFATQPGRHTNTNTSTHTHTLIYIANKTEFLSCERVIKRKLPKP